MTVIFSYVRRLWFYVAEPVRRLLASRRIGLAALVLAAAVAVLIYWLQRDLLLAAWFFGAAVLVIGLFWLIALVVGRRGRRRGRWGR